MTKVANGMQELVDEKGDIEKIAQDMFATTRSAFYIGRGGGLCISPEAALKLKEVSYVQTEGFASGELKARHDRLDRRRYTSRSDHH